jgi:alpha-ribazole phosphatase
MNIFLIRHTEIYNPGKLCYGQSEIPLAENFTSHFDWLSDTLEHLPKEDTVYYSSPFRRCTKLASYLSNDKYVTDKRLSELNFGKWEMQAWNEIKRKDLDKWMEDFVGYKIPGGENFTALYKRCIDFYSSLLNSEIENHIIVTHAGVVRSILAYILDFPLKKAFDLEISYSSISKITYNDNFQKSKIQFINRTQQIL